MSKTPSLPSYTELESALRKIEPNSNVAQIHGFICGVLCVTSGEIGDIWKKILPTAKNPKKTKVMLTEIYENTYHQLNEFSFEFSLLLPDDEDDINARAEALGLWCQGFLTGLEESPEPVRKHAPAEVVEGLDDLLEIAKINFGDIASNEEDETAYYELSEYVRLTVLMIYQELKSGYSGEEGLISHEAETDD